MFFLCLFCLSDQLAFIWSDSRWDSPFPIFLVWHAVFVFLKLWVLISFWEVQWSHSSPGSGLHLTCKGLPRSYAIKCCTHHGISILLHWIKFCIWFTPEAITSYTHSLPCTVSYCYSARSKWSETSLFFLYFWIFAKVYEYECIIYEKIKGRKSYEIKRMSGEWSRVKYSDFRTPLFNKIECNLKN